jgi:hypothetical protein
MLDVSQATGPWASFGGTDEAAADVVVAETGAPPEPAGLAHR